MPKIVQISEECYTSQDSGAGAEQRKHMDSCFALVNAFLSKMFQCMVSFKIFLLCSVWIGNSLRL